MIKALFSIVDRLAAALVLCCVLGLQLAGAASSSHEITLPGSPDIVDAAMHVVADDDDGMRDTGHAVGAEHSHQHDPADHSHDVPLPPSLRMAALTFSPFWEISPYIPQGSRAPLPLERPPKTPLAV